MKVLTTTLVCLFTLGTVGTAATQGNDHRVYDVAGCLRGQHLQDITFDSQGCAYFVTMEPDTVTETPVLSSSLPMWRYLERYDATADSFETIDTSFPPSSKILFDRQDNLWIMTGKAVHRRSGSDASDQAVIQLREDGGLFRDMAVDNTNNVWICGLNTGLYKVASDLTLTHYSPSNSPLPANSMTAVHATEAGSIWIAMWYNIGVVEIDDDTWTIHDPHSTQAPLHKVWCIDSDPGGTLWFGTSPRQRPASLVRFDGTSWSIESIKDARGAPIEGATVRKLTSDSSKLWILATKGENTHAFRQILRTFNGSEWAVVPGIAEDASISDIRVNAVDRVVWIGEINREQHRTWLHRIGY